MPHRFLPRLLQALFLCVFTIFSQRLIAQCAAPTLAEVRYVYPYRAWIAMTMPWNATALEAEAVPEGEAFSGVPNATGPADGLFFFNILQPGTAYQWRARAVCDGLAGNWSAVHTFTTPPPCPPAPMVPLDSAVTLTFPTTPHPNIGYAVCGELTDWGGSYVWGFRTLVAGIYQLEFTAATGPSGVKVAQSSGVHPECRALYVPCLSVNTAAGQTYAFTLAAGDSIYFGFHYSEPVPATRTFRIRTAPCPAPTNAAVSSVSSTTARLTFSSGVPVDVEVVPDVAPFTGVPNYGNVVDSVTLTGLQPGTGYRWRLRGHCTTGGTSAWASGPTFETHTPCDSLPVVRCDSTYTFEFKPGVGNYYFGEYATDGREIVVRYRPERSDVLWVTANRPSPNGEFLVAWRDSAVADCNAGPWPQYQKYYNVPHTTPLGYMQAGRTYYLLLDHAGYDTLTVTLNLRCPDDCPAPWQPRLLDTLQNAATLHWQNSNVSAAYELELRPVGEPLTGTPTHSGTGDTHTIGGLFTASTYHWRVRSVCAGLPGPWSVTVTFTTLPDCSATSTITCGQTVTVNSNSGVDYFKPCSSYDAQERYYLFTPPYDGQYTLTATATGNIQAGFAYGIKPAVLDCSAQDWVCLDFVYTQSTLTTPLLQGQQAYRIVVDRPIGSSLDYAQQFTIGCPTPCVVADSLYVTGLGAGRATLGWRLQGNEVHWDVELRPMGEAFIGVPNYTSAALALIVDDLVPGLTYHWRVRNDCGSLGLSDWSDELIFATAPVCQSMPCGEQRTVLFVPGNGFYPHAVCSAQVGHGQDAMLTFTLGPGETKRYLSFLPGSAEPTHFQYYLAKSNGDTCAVYGQWWQCLEPFYPATSVFTLQNLEPGATYFLRILKLEAAGHDTLVLRVDCTQPCPLPTTLWTSVTNANSVTAHWNGSLGPWYYQVGIWQRNGPAVGTYNSSYWNFANIPVDPLLEPEKVYEWRLRLICESGDTSAWSDAQFFKPPVRCAGATLLDCHAAATNVFNPADDYAFLSACSGDAYGQYTLYRLEFNSAGGPYALQITGGSGAPFTYTLSGPDPAFCQSLPWPVCTTMTAPGIIPLNNLLLSGTYYLQVQRTEPAAGSQTIQLLCSCDAPTAGSGLLQLDGTAALSWSGGSAATGYEVELRPQGTAFSAQPTHTANGPALSVSGLPITGYRYRVRTVCATGVPGNWSDAFPVARVTNCAHPLVLTCGDTSYFHVEAGYGDFDYAPCGFTTPGREAFLQVNAGFPGDYSLRAVHAAGLAGLGYASVPQCGDTNIINCLYVGSSSPFPLGFLTPGTPYHILADNDSIFSGTFGLALGCPVNTEPPINDEPYPLAAWPAPAYNAITVPVNAPCQVYTNRLATPGIIDPDPTLAPGNWYDTTEHSVWFIFEAPPGGTVRITAESYATDPMDPQLALVRLDSAGVFPYVLRVLAAGEDQPSPNAADAQLTYTGLEPGATYFVLVDGAGGTEGLFCLRITDTIALPATIGQCETYSAPAPAVVDSAAWRNLYASDGAHVTGPLIAALKTTDDLGTVTISTERLADPPVLPGGQKMLPRYVNIETQYAPQLPVKVRLFFTAEDLAEFNLTPPVTVATPFDLGVTHYDGTNEDCDPLNNALVADSLGAQADTAVLVGANGVFFLETTVSSFSELGATLALTVPAAEPASPEIAVQIVPNPVADVLAVRVVAAQPLQLRVALLTLTGQPLWNDYWDQPAYAPARSWPVGGLAAGVYVLEVQAGNGVVRRVLVAKL